MKVDVTEEQALDVFKFLGKRIDKSLDPILIRFDNGEDKTFEFGYIDDKTFCFSIWSENGSHPFFSINARTYRDILKYCLKVAQDSELFVCEKSFLHKGTTLEQILLEMDLANGCF